MTPPRIRQAGVEDAESWAVLREALWPEEDPIRHPQDIRDLLARADGAAAFLARDEGGAAIGFAEATLRRDYVNGSDRSPVGFLEGWYVVPAHRKHGVGRALIGAVEDWTRRQGCTELASDALLDNDDSHRAHRACGFEETERVVYFLKTLER